MDRTNLIYIKDKNQYTYLLSNTTNLAVIDFYAEWCGPCKVIGPLIDKLSESYENILFLKIDVDSNEELSKDFAIRSIPTICFIKNNEILYKHVGSLTVDKLIKFIEDYKK